MMDTPKVTTTFHLALASIPLIPQVAEISNHRYAFPKTALHDYHPCKGHSNNLCCLIWGSAFVVPAVIESACPERVDEWWDDHRASGTPRGGPWLLRELPPLVHLHIAPKKAFQHPKLRLSSFGGP